MVKLEKISFIISLETVVASNTTSALCQDTVVVLLSILTILLACTLEEASMIVSLTTRED